MVRTNKCATRLAGPVFTLEGALQLNCFYSKGKRQDGQWSTTLVRLPNQRLFWTTLQNSMLEDFVYSKEQDDFSPSKQLSPDLTFNQMISFKRRYRIDMRFECKHIEEKNLGLIFHHLPLWKKDLEIP